VITDQMGQQPVKQPNNGHGNGRRRHGQQFGQ
jgi:hypothetical protein